MIDKMNVKKLFKNVVGYIVLGKQCTFITAYVAVYLGVAEDNLAANAQFFQNITDKIENNLPRLSYGVAVTDFNDDGKLKPSSLIIDISKSEFLYCAI